MPEELPWEASKRVREERQAAADKETQIKSLTADLAVIRRNIQTATLESVKAGYRDREREVQQKLRDLGARA